MARRRVVIFKCVECDKPLDCTLIVTGDDTNLLPMKCPFGGWASQWEKIYDNHTKEIKQD